ncbi:TRAP transporter large permease [Chloroflexota bacterium]
MSTDLIGVIGLIVLLALIFFGMPVGVAMALIGFVGITVLSGLDVSFTLAQIIPFHKSFDYVFSVLPLFFLMGNFAFHAGIGSDFFDTARKWFGHFRGGLAVATTAACAGFGAATGSSMATVATMTRVALPEMRQANYDDALSTGVIAASGTLAALIPPSVIVVIFAIIVETSVAQLLIAGIIPGIWSALIYVAMILVISRLNPKLGPPVAPARWRERFKSLKDVWALGLVILVVIGGLYFGIFTPTECGALGAFGVFLLTIARRRLTWHKFKDSLLDTSMTTATIFILLVGLTFFTRFMALSGLTVSITNYLGNLPVPNIVILIMVLMIYLFLGLFMEGVSMMFLTLPTVYPLMMELGYSPIWFGIILVKMIEIAVITPPVGINVYMVKAVLGDDVKLETVFRAIVPFFLMDVLTVITLIIFPQVVTFLPDLMYKG